MRKVVLVAVVALLGSYPAGADPPRGTTTTATLTPHTHELLQWGFG